MGGQGHHHAGRRRALTLSLAANAVLLAAQVVGALLFGSLALLADSVHQLSDVISLTVAAVALHLASRPSSEAYTYGLRRAEVVGALANAVVLLAAVGWIVVEALQRLEDPAEIEGGGVVALAVLGLGVNATSAWGLRRVAGANLNLRSAMIHLTADAAGSVAVLASGLAVLLWDLHRVDPALSLLIAGLAAWQGARIIGATTHIFLEGTPRSVDIAELEALLRSDEDVQDVHHLHVWSLDSEHVALTAHVVADPPTLHAAQQLSARLEARLADRGVGHATLALECHPCDEPTEAACAEEAARGDVSQLS